MKSLIVNADDFGYSESVNKGIIKAHVDGIVSSTSVMVYGKAVEAARTLSNYPALGVGLHLVLQKDTDIAMQLNEQVRAFGLITGKFPDHIDVHKLVEPDETIERIVKRYAIQNGIPIRRGGYAKFINRFYGGNDPADVTLDGLARAISDAVEDINELMCHPGYSDDELRRLSTYNDLREKELATLCDPKAKQLLKVNDLRLVNWQAIEIPNKRY